MENVTITIDLPVSRLAELQSFLENRTTETPVQISGFSAPEEPAKTEAPEPVKAEAPAEPEPVKVTRTMLRAKGLELVKADKQAELEAVFAKFGAKQLRDLPEDKYAEAYSMMEAL